MSDILRELAQTIADGLTDRTLTSCSRWSARRRIMGAPFPGPYSWKRHSWCREILDSSAPFNYAMKGAQLGVTEVAINRAFYVLDQLKRDVLYVLPTALNAADFSKARFNAALAMSPYLKSAFSDTDAVGLKRTATNSLYIRGSRGDSNLKSIPVSDLILDEVDEMEQKQIWLALERLSGQVEKHVWGISTPTIPNYGVHKLYLESTQEHFFFKCPCCGRQTELVWPDCVEIVGEAVNDSRCGESFLKCKECKGKLCHEAKGEWLANATWQPTVDANPHIRGFQISQLYSSTVTPGELVVAYFRGFGDEMANKEFHTSKLGLPFLGDGAKLSDDVIDRCIGDFTTSDERPRYGGERLITMGVDQGKLNHIVIIDWKLDRKDRDVNAVARGKLVWFGVVLEEEWDRISELMAEWQVLACFVDADPNINSARQFARKHWGYVWLTRYRRGTSAREFQIVEKDTAPIAQCDRSNWLACTLNRFKAASPRLLLPRDVTKGYRDHLKNMVRSYQRDEHGEPRLVYLNTGPDHFVHATTYADMALKMAVKGQNENIGKAP